MLSVCPHNYKYDRQNQTHCVGRRGSRSIQKSSSIRHPVFRTRCDNRSRSNHRSPISLDRTFFNFKNHPDIQPENHDTHSDKSSYSKIFDLPVSQMKFPRLDIEYLYMSNTPPEKRLQMNSILLRDREEILSYIA